jgi:hypothetical protein
MYQCANCWPGQLDMDKQQTNAKVGRASPHGVCGNSLATANLQILKFSNFQIFFVS